MNLIEYPDRDLLMMDLADAMASDLKSALLTHDAISLAVAGGTSPGPVFDILSVLHLDWDLVTVLPTDERCVPVDHPRSNARLISERLLVEQAAAARFLPLYRDGSPEHAVDTIGPSVAEISPVSVMLLGMGTDMHTASLFPGTEGLETALDPHAAPLSVLRPADQPEARISLSAPILSGALQIHLLITGIEKREALEKALHLTPQEAPVRLILDAATVHWSE